MKIVYLSAIAYDDLKQRPQYMAEKLSEKMKSFISNRQFGGFPVY